ncbi:glycosyltransferase family 2 protein [Pontimonas sp.]|nr:glycosyltransferase family 2 protein [Pontimonas sp.]
MVPLKLSVIVPFYNEVEILSTSIKRTLVAAEACSPDFEIILVDNRSDDGSTEIARSYAESDRRIKLIRFSRNFGPTVEGSIMAGLTHCSGEAAALIYSDMQDPPELLPEMYSKLHEGNHVVYGVQTGRKGESLFNKSAARFFYWTMAALSDSPINHRSGEFFLISRRVIDVLLAMPESSRFTRGLIPWIGFDSVGIPYLRQARVGGKSKSKLSNVIPTAINGVTGFSNTPLRALLYFSGFITLTAFVALAALLVFWLQGQTVPGVTTAIALGLLNLGISVGALGIVGEYIARISSETKRRPLYVIDETYNF